jgi:hypothetical protein
MTSAQVAGALDYESSSVKRTTEATAFKLKVEFSREVDRRWIADIPAFAGVTVYHPVGNRRSSSHIPPYSYSQTKVRKNSDFFRTPGVSMNGAKS